MNNFLLKFFLIPDIYSFESRVYFDLSSRPNYRSQCLIFALITRWKYLVLLHCESFNERISHLWQFLDYIWGKNLVKNEIKNLYFILYRISGIKANPVNDPRIHYSLISGVKKIVKILDSTKTSPQIYLAHLKSKLSVELSFVLLIVEQ